MPAAAALAALAVGLGALMLSVVTAAPASAAVLPPAPTEAAELGQALDALGAAVGLSTKAADRGGPGVAERSAQVASASSPSAGQSSSAQAGPIDPGAVAAAVTRLQAADLLFRDRLATVADRLEAIGASGDIFDRFQRARARYQASVAAILDPLAPALTPPAGPETGGVKAGAEEDPPEARAAHLRALAGTLADADTLDTLRSALRSARTDTSPEILRAAVLPYGRLSLAQRTPAEEPAVQPASLDPLDPAATSADLAASRLAPLSDPILLEAERLDHDLVKIFERVRNGIATEWYAGAMKGAEETLRQRAGNDADQAALLVALLRASGVPARFVRGVVELSPEQIGDDLGLVGGAAGGASDVAPDRVAEALRRSGVAFRPIVRGGGVAAFAVEQVWVEARIPYTNYRGAVVDLSGPTWLPLAPAATASQGTPSAAVLSAMAADGELTAGGFVDEVLAAPQVDDPLTMLRPRVADYLDRTGGPSYDDALGSRQVVPQTLGLLPSSLPFPVIAVTGEWSALPDALTQRVRFVVRAGAEETSPVLLDWTAPVAELAGHRVTLSYVPATVEDQRVVNAFGGLGAVPLYLVRLRPQIKVDGRPRAEGSGGTGATGEGGVVDAGATHRLEVELLAPAGPERIGRQVTAGGYYALGFGAQRSDGAEDVNAMATAEPDPSDTESPAARVLAGVGRAYGASWDAAEDELAGLAGVSVLRPLPSVAIVGNAVAVETALGLPEQLRWQGVTLDAALRAAEPITSGIDSAASGLDPGAAAGAERGWLALAALQGSALEHQVFEDSFLVDAISADEGLGLARQAGVDVVHLTPADAGSGLPGLDQPAAVLQDVESWLRLGMEVEIPRGPIVESGWQGSVWRVIDPEGRGAGYFIAGSLAGGATADPPGSWVNDFLASLLASPYAPTPNRNPLAAAEVVKIPASDRQTATVGEAYAQPLAVLVRDADGRPVAGAPVTFEAWSGGGSFVHGDGTSSTSVTVPSGPLGIATARFRSGTDTAEEPIYTLRRPDDFKPTRALVNLVEVTVLSASGTLAPAAPFELIAYPGSVETLRRTDTDRTVFVVSGLAGLWADTIHVAAEDHYGNPVSNVQVHFEVGDMFSFDGCANGETEPRRNAVVFDPTLSVNGTVLACPSTPPMLGDCGGPIYSGITGVHGTAAGVILGSSLVTTYTVDASVGGITPLHFEYRAVFDQFEPNGDCATLGGFRVFATTASDGQGNNIQATRPGRLYPDAVHMTFLHPLHEVDVIEESTPDGSRFSLKQRLDFDWVRVPGDVELRVSNGGAATEPTADGDLVYGTLLTTGSTPGFNQLRVVAHDFDFPVWRVSQLTGTPYQETHKASEFIGTLFQDPILDQPVTGVWGVLPKVLSVTPDPPVLLPTGQTTEEVVVGYGIDPLEYLAQAAEIDLLEDGVLRGTSIGDLRQAGGYATIQRGFPFDVDRSYDLQLVLNRGSEAEVRSDRFPLPLYQRILENVTRSVYVDQDVDLVNGRSCGHGGDFRYTLTQQATVTLEVRPIDGLGTDGAPELGAPMTVIDGVLQDEGEVALTLSPGTLPPGDYSYTLRAVSAADGRTEEVQGTIRAEYHSRDALPVGHTLVQGVDLWDGHLALSREDLSYPGRGPALALRRSYSSNTGTEPGPMGVGWSHNYESRVVVTPCGEAIVIGGEGSGMRFVDDGEGGLKPLKGYHGTLIANADDGSFDFYAKGGNRYRYSLGYGREVYLTSIEDPNGNTTRLVYESGTGGRPRLTAVVDPSGRKLTFQYAPGQFALLEDTVLTRVDGPAGSGQSISFSYDAFGNLVRAEREDGARAETYTYATEPTDLFEDRHVLLSATDALDGGTTAYETTHGEIRATADVVVPSTFYLGVTLPEGGKTSFAYDTAGLATRADQELVTRVTDPRDQTTAYALNQYGSPLRITDPLGHETSMTWAADDVVMTSRTDAKGVTTTFDHDGDGNLLRETVTFTGPDGGDVTYSRSFTYAPAESFDPPYIKERVATRTDRNGATTRFTYDAHGDLLEQRIGVTGPDGGAPRDLVTSNTYLDNGDRASTTDPRGKTTRFSYDGYGNLATVTDPVGAVTTTEYDVRSLPGAVTDPLGRRTELSYDSLGRLVKRVLPRAAGESAAPEETLAYDDVADTLTQTDAAGRTTVTTSDREDRVVRIDNAAGGTKIFAYDAAGNKTLETGWFDGATPRIDTTFVYDAAGRLTERREPPTGSQGRTTTYAYDPVGNLVREELSDRTDSTFAPRVTESAYDGLNRKVEERRLTDAGPVVRTMRYDGVGNLVQAVDPLGREIATDFDELGRPVRVREPEGKETVTVYDGAGNPIEQRRLNTVDGTADGTRVDQVRTSTYDGAGRVIEQTDALGQTIHLEYDLAGNLLRRIDRRLDVTSYTYDARNRRVTTTQHLTRVSDPQRQVTTTYAYDAVGNRIEEHWPNGDVVTHSYDALDRKIRSEDSLGLLEAATYDARGNQLTATDANGNVTTTTYDALDRPVRVELPPRKPEPRVTTRTFDAAGNTLTQTDPRGHTTTFAYDRLDRRVRTTAPEPFGYTTETAYDAAGNVLTRTDGRGLTTTFAYDDLNRLTRRTDPAPLSYETSYTYL